MRTSGVLAIALLAFLPSILFSQDASTIPLSAQLPLDTAITVGRLPNGLKYYIKYNRKPEKRAELRLAVNAGSILENDSQQGLAHFCEHMAFNGTKNFPKQALVDYLESAGVRFGPDLNAYTSFDETVYMIQVPTDTASILERGLDILEDWAHLVAYSDEEIEKERGVVMEEWRLGRGANARMQDKILPIIFKDSRYAQRLPIGKPEIISSCPHDTLRQFYRDWYRPDLMAVIVVGDIKKDAIEQLIKKHFADIPTPATERARADFSVPGHAQTYFAIATDPEATSTSLRVAYLREKRSVTSAHDYRRGIVEGLFTIMLNQRFQEETRKPDPPFVYAGGGSGSFVRTKDVFQMTAIVRDGGIMRGLEALTKEAARVRKYGFTATELERAKTEALRGIEQAYNERDKSESAGFAAEYVRNYLTQEPAPGIAYEFDLYRRFVPGVTLEEVNALATSSLPSTDRVVTIEAPEKSSPTIPDTIALAALIDNIDRMDVQPYVDIVADRPLMSKLPAPGTIVGRQELKELGVTEALLSNGVKVYMKPTDFKNDEVLFSAFAPGGSSLVPDSDYIAATTACAVLSQGGLADFDLTVLNKLLAGKIVDVTPFIGELGQGMGGGCSPKDLEAMFQLIHLRFTAPRPDSTAFQSYLTRTRAMLENRSARPEAVFGDSVQVILSQHHFRRRPFTIPMLDDLNLGKSLAIYRDRFADASGFTFVIVGNFKTADLEPLLTRYLASLPALKRNETWRDIGLRPPAGIVEKTVHRGIEPKSQVRLVFSGPFTWTRENRYAVDALREVLTIKLRESLREEKGGTYGVGVGGNPIRIPVQRYQFGVSFGCAPDRVEEMLKETFVQFDSLKQYGPSQEIINKVKETELRDREVQLKQNGFWLSSLQFCLENEIDPALILTYTDMVKTLTPTAVQAAAREYLNFGQYARFELLPE